MLAIVDVLVNHKCSVLVVFNSGRKKHAREKDQIN